MVVGVLLYFLLEDDDALKGRTEGDNTECCIILLLLAHKHIANFGIVDHIRHLCPTACGIEGNGDGTNAVCTKVHVQALGFVLREDANLLLYCHTEFQKRMGNGIDISGKLAPRDGQPSILFVVAVGQGHLILILFSLRLDKVREVLIVEHGISFLSAEEEILAFFSDIPSFFGGGICANLRVSYDTGK